MTKNLSQTIAGGAGAGPTWKGQSGVHVHMTNTRITDPETIEKRYPCILHEFSIRKGSGGRGRFNGGDGCIRDIEFRVPVELSVLTERRTIAPYGMCGGGPGACGENIWVKRDQSTGKVREISLGGKNTCNMAAGDRIIIRKSSPSQFANIDVDVWRELNANKAQEAQAEALTGKFDHRDVANYNDCDSFS